MDHEKTYKWIQDRLRDLRSGTLSENDRLQLFELAKDDPFIKDAIEGYQSAVHHDHTPNLRYISHRIQNKGIAKRHKLLPDKRGWALQAIAASLVLILVTWAVIYYIGQNETNVLVATETPTTVTENPNVYSNPDIANDDGSDMALEESVGKELNEEPSGLRANAQSRADKALSGDEKTEDIIVTDALIKEKEDQTLSGPVSPPSAAPATKTEVDKGAVMETYSIESNETMADQDSRVKKDEGYYANQMNPALMQQRVTGQIIDPYGQPIPGAFVVIENSNLVSTSNQYGQFEIFLPNQTSTVNVSSSGYMDTAITVSQGNEDLVVMLSQEDSSDKYSPAGAVQSKVMTKSSTGQLNKNITYPDYLKANSRYTISDKYTSTSKEITLEFSISTSGRPEKVNALKTNVDDKYVAEAIRLIENGPDWECVRDYPCKIKYSIYFK